MKKQSNEQTVNNAQIGKKVGKECDSYLEIFVIRLENVESVRLEVAKTREIYARIR